jgi:transcription termination/antitermination protein NusA
VILLDLTGEELELLSFFSKITGANAVDFVKTDFGYAFMVDSADLGRAIGKGGATIERLRHAFKQNVFVFADSEDLEAFVRGMFSNIRINSMEIREAMGERSVLMTVHDRDRGLAIGKEGSRIKAAKQILKSKFNATVSVRTRKVAIEIPEGVNL